MKLCGLLKKTVKRIWGFFFSLWFKLKEAWEFLLFDKAVNLFFVIPLLKSVQQLVELPREVLKQDNIELEALNM